MAELVDSDIVLDAQAKKGFSRSPGFDQVIEAFARSLAAVELPRAVEQALLRAS